MSHTPTIEPATSGFTSEDLELLEPPGRPVILLVYCRSHVFQLGAFGRADSKRIKIRVFSLSSTRRPLNVAVRCPTRFVSEDPDKSNKALELDTLPKRCCEGDSRLSQKGQIEVHSRNQFSV